MLVAPGLYLSNDTPCRQDQRHTVGSLGVSERRTRYMPLDCLSPHPWAKRFGRWIPLTSEHLCSYGCPAVLFAEAIEATVLVLTPPTT
jgi:hypothetical protein